MKNFILMVAIAAFVAGIALMLGDFGWEADLPKDSDKLAVGLGALLLFVSFWVGRRKS